MTKAELQPFTAIVGVRRKKNPDSKLWVTLGERWSRLVGSSGEVVSAYENGSAMNRYQRLASREIMKLADHVGADEVIDTSLAMFILQEQMPFRFKSDDAFWHQLTRRVRGLTAVNAGSWFDHSTGKTRRVYQDLPPSATVIIGKSLSEAFGGAGFMLARKEAEDAERQRNETMVMAEAIRELE